MPIGELNKRIQIQAETKIPDGMGNFNTVWINVGDPIWAAIWPTNAKETVQSMQPMGTITHRIRVRHKSVLKASWRIKFGHRYFAIVAPPINLNERNEWLDLMCQEVA